LSDEGQVEVLDAFVNIMLPYTKTPTNTIQNPEASSC
jgi:hypothetical protein